MRAILRTVLDAWLKSDREGAHKSDRAPLRLDWAEEVLAPETLELLSWAGATLLRAGLEEPG
jgi:hypothetical protein